MSGNSASSDAYFADRLEQFGDATAIVADSGETLSYRQLAKQADSWAARLGKHRWLVLIAAGNDVPSVVAYLGCLRHRHPLILTEAGNVKSIQRLCDQFQPDAVFSPEEVEWNPQVENKPPARFHPDLAILLTTSGSTGDSKLVRLSFQNIEANAKSICAYLGIDAAQRAASTLPLFYSYGLSVINSHLAVGASIFLTSASLIDQGFWESFNRLQCTSFAGVPYSFKLLDQVGFETKQFAALQYVTQAGGKLPPQDVLRFARLGKDKGWRFFVMYGQTEASPRISYLPPDLTESYPESIGIAIPGGTLSVRNPNGDECDVDVPGELFYSGPNVMMGYAYVRADLERGGDSNELATGDIAYRNKAGLFTIIGRKSRFSKIAGRRISFDDLEARLKIKGYDVVCTGNDERLAIATLAPDDTGALRREAAVIAGLPLSYVAVVSVAEIPRLATEKYDYLRIMELATQVAPGKGPASASILQAFQSVLPGIDVHPSSTLEGLGGDSLSEIELGFEIENRLGFLPENWTKLSVADMDAMLTANKSSIAANVRTSSVKTTPANTLRGLACITITLQHVIGDSPLLGLRLDSSHWLAGIVDVVNYTGASLLFFVAGYLTIWPVRQTLGEMSALLRLRLVRIFVPLIMLTTAYFAARSAVGSESLKFWQALTSSYIHLWFLQALMIVLIIMAGFSYVFAGNEKRLVLFLAVPAVLLYAYSDLLLTDIFSISSAFLQLPFFLAGLAARAWNVTEVRQSARPWAAAGAAALVVIILAIEAASIPAAASRFGFADFDIRNLFGLPVTIGLYILLLIAGPRSKVLSFIGMAAFEIYLFHIFFATGGRYFLSFVFPETPLMLKLVILTSVALVGPILLARIIARSRVLAFLFLGRFSGLQR